MGQALMQGQARLPRSFPGPAARSRPPGTAVQLGPEGALLQLCSLQLLPQGLELLRSQGIQLDHQVNNDMPRPTHPAGSTDSATAAS